MRQEFWKSRNNSTLRERYFLLFRTILTPPYIFLYRPRFDRCVKFFTRLRWRPFLSPRDPVTDDEISRECFAPKRYFFPPQDYNYTRLKLSALLSFEIGRWRVHPVVQRDACCTRCATIPRPAFARDEQNPGRRYSFRSSDRPNDDV